MNGQSIRFGIKLSAFLATILVLSYAVAAIAPRSSEDPGIKIEYALVAP